MINYDVYNKSMEKWEVGSVSYYHSHTNSSFSNIHRLGRMQGAKRVVVFCLLIAVLPVVLLFIPLYLRHKVYADIKFPVAESDIIEMINGISSVFCQEHSLRMESSFNAFQVKGKPKMSLSKRKHIHLEKNLSLTDDTLEYWGFFLPSSSTVNLSVCSRYKGSSILVVKGEKNLRSCGLRQPMKPKLQEQNNIHVTEVTEERENEKVPNSLEEDGGEVADDFIESRKGKPSLIDKKVPISNHVNRTNSTTETNNSQEVPADKLSNHRQRHQRSRKKALEKELYGDQTIRKKREVDAYKLDGGIAHGGNALNFSAETNDSSLSSFENSLLTCYEGQILLSKEFYPSRQCNSTAYMKKSKHMNTVHNVTVDGYYYYIFFSDNDDEQNDMYAIFDIHKPTYEYGNYSLGCINQTNCSFPISFWSDEVVIVEVPTRDGIENENDDITILTSTCHPRSAVYAIFPIAVIFVILLFAFI